MVVTLLATMVVHGISNDRIDGIGNEVMAVIAMTVSMVLLTRRRQISKDGCDSASKESDNSASTMVAMALAMTVAMVYTN